MTRFILTLEVTSDRDPSDLLDEIIALELDDVEVDEDSACVEEVDFGSEDTSDLLHDRAPHLLGFMCHLLWEKKIVSASLPDLLEKPWKWQPEYTEYVAYLAGRHPSLIERV